MHEPELLGKLSALVKLRGMMAFFFFSPMWTLNLEFRGLEGIQEMI